MAVVVQAGAAPHGVNEPPALEEQEIAWGAVTVAGPLPWVLLSEGAGYDDFAVQMEIAAGAGASGYIAGRAVWGDAVGDIPEAERLRALARAGERLTALNKIVRGYGRPWFERIPADPVPSTLPPDWYGSYGG